ncbi:MAG: D-arabinono-1,4-lactone oxidase, partial [Actinomycetota bacterium]
PYFKAVEEIMDSYQGRPHWGKIHFQTADSLRTKYPQFEQFCSVRASVDPARVFGNVYLKKVLGN